MRAIYINIRSQRRKKGDIALESLCSLPELHLDQIPVLLFVIACRICFWFSIIFYANIIIRIPTSHLPLPKIREIDRNTIPEDLYIIGISDKIYTVGSAPGINKPALAMLAKPCVIWGKALVDLISK